MKLIRDAFAGSLLAGSTAVVACSGELAPTSTAGGNMGVANPDSTAAGGTTGSSPGNATGSGTTTGRGGTGAVLTVLTIPANSTQLQSLTYTISGGPGGSYGPHTEAIGGAQSIEWVSDGIVPGCGYTVAVTGSDPQGDVCSGTSRAFCVVASQVTSVNLSFTCTRVPTAAIDAGVMVVHPNDAGVQQGGTDAGALLQCPTIASVAASPALLLENEPSTVSATTDPASADVVWSAVSPDGGGGSGTIGGFFGTDGGASSSGDSLSFNCGSFVGEVTITAQTQLEVVPLGQDASINSCSGAPFTSKETQIICVGTTP